jgi:hypothetical protein
MTLAKSDLSKLNRIIALAETLIAVSSKAREKNRRSPSRNKANGKRRRRAGGELTKFRKMLKAQRKKGVPVAELARKHGVSTAYIYMLP